MASEQDAKTEKKGKPMESSRSSLINSQNLLDSSRNNEHEINNF
jgi:hypothetical protein